jgi:hypothetical protein
VTAKLTFVDQLALASRAAVVDLLNAVHAGFATNALISIHNYMIWLSDVANRLLTYMVDLPHLDAIKACELQN